MADLHPASPRSPQAAAARQRAGGLGTGSSADGRRATLLAAVVEATRLLLAGDDLPAAMHQAVAALGERIGLARVAVCAFRHGDADPWADGAWWLEAVWEAPGVPGLLGVHGPGPYAAAGAHDLLAAHRAGRPFVAPATHARAAPPAKRGHHAAVDAAATATLPVHVAGAYWGLVRFDDHAGERAWTDGELAALAGVADALAAAVGRARREAARRDALAAERATDAEARASDAERLSALLRGVVAASRALLDAPTFEAGLDAWLRALAEAAGAERATFGTLADARDAEGAAAFVHLAVWARPGMSPLPNGPPPRTADFDRWASRLRAGEVVQGLYRELVDPRSRAFWDAIDCRAGTILPVHVDGRVWGWIFFDNADAGCRQDADVAVLLSASDGIGLAVRREEALRAALAERAARERAEQARAAELAETNARLARSMTRLTGEASPDAFVYQLHRELCDILGGDATSQYEILGDHGVGGQIADASEPADAPHEIPWFQHTHEVWGVASLQEDRVHRLDYPRDAALLGADSVACMRAHGFSWLARLPLFVNGAPRWLLAVGGRDAARLTEPNLALFRTLARQLTLALELRRLAEAGRQAAVAEERNALAREVHDTLAQGLSGIVMQIGAARAQLGPAADAAPALDRVERLAREHLAAARRSIAALRPGFVGAGPTAPGQAAAAHLEPALRAAVRAACDAAAGAGGVPEVTVAVQGPAAPLPADVGSELLRIAQAALANALGHAGARRVVVDLAYPRADAPAGAPTPAAGLRISVADDGRGFDPDAPRPGRYGLAGMYERAARVGAELTLVTAPGEGTEVVVMWCPHRYAAVTGAGDLA